MSVDSFSLLIVHLLEQKHSAGNTLEKIVSGYHVVYGHMDEDVILSKCRNAINFVEKVDKEIGSDINAGMFLRLYVQHVLFVMIYMCCMFTFSESLSVRLILG